MDKEVIVEYRTIKHDCPCCGQSIKNPKESDNKMFRFFKRDFIDWASQESWQIEASDPDSLDYMVRDFVAETISFYAVDSEDQLLIENSEFAKVRKFVQGEIVNKC